jgi:hypothetical protein
MAIRSIQLPDGTSIEIDEWLHWPTFSVIEFNAGAKVNLRAFTYVQGNPVSSQGLAIRTATEADTNQVVKQQTNYDESILVYDITYEPFALSDASFESEQVTTVLAPAPLILSTNLHRLQRDLMVELYVGAKQTKPQFRAPFSFVGQSIGAPMWGPGGSPAAGFNISYGTGGYPTPENARRLELPVYIESAMTFYLKVYSNAAISDLTQDISLRFYLDGLKRRPVG